MGKPGSAYEKTSALRGEGILRRSTPFALRHAADADSISGVRRLVGWLGLLALLAACSSGTDSSIPLLTPVPDRGIAASPSADIPLATPSLNPVPTLPRRHGGTREPSTRPGWSTYVGGDYRVAFDFPADWDVPRVEYGEPRFEGESGFVMLNAGSHVNDPQSPGLLELCRIQSSHKLRPYGTTPDVIATTVADRAACLILPSTDQPAAMRNVAEADIDAPAPVLGMYRHLILYADAAHIRAILETLRFLPGP